MTPRAELLVIGNEILSGKVEDEHSGYLCRELRALGIDVRRIVVLPDEIESIADAVQLGSSRSDLMVTTGGIGPTHDDVTIAGIARGLGRPLVKHPALQSLLRGIYGDGLTEAIARLADVPEGSELIFAPGLRVPVLKVDKVYVFPGVPEAFRRKFEAIKDRFRHAPFFLRKIYVTVGEEAIAESLYDTLKRYPDLLLGSYPATGRVEYRVMLTLESKDPELLDAAHQDLVCRLPKESVVELREGRAG